MRLNLLSPNLTSHDELTFDLFPRDMARVKPHEMKDAMQLEIRTNGEEYLSHYIECLTEMYTRLPTIRGMSPENLELLFDCAENVIKCNVI